MSVVDALELSGTADDHPAPARSRRHALVALFYVSALFFLGYQRMRGRYFYQGFYMAFLPGFFWFVALVFWIIRTGRLRIDRGSVRWGWRVLAFRMPAEKMKRIELYRDGAAVLLPRGTRWYLLARDWERWPEASAALGRLPVERVRRDAGVPLWGRLQSYGRALDVMLVLNSVAATLVFLSI